MTKNPINPAFKLEFTDLYNRDGLQKIDEYFLEFLKDNTDSSFYQKYLIARSDPQSLNKKEQSDLLIAVGRFLENFLAMFFNICQENSALQKQHSNLANLYIAKRLFVQRRVAKKYSSSSADCTLGINHNTKRDDLENFELNLANKITTYLKEEKKYLQQLEELEKYCAWALFSDEGRQKHKEGVLFKIPKKLDFNNLVELEEENGVKKSPDKNIKNRDGFKLTDKGCNLDFALDQAKYCIYCHNQGKDSCSVGLKEKEGSFKSDTFGTQLSGCPLDQKISEMNFLKSEGNSIAALAMAVVDNPMIAGTGHRICNDCMKACIYQKQSPVDIPQIETRTLKDVLDLPYGFEIYSLLTRWNPLNLERILAKEPSGYKVLIAGLGPAGYTLAHHLLNEGHLVVGVDGLKIEPLNKEISGIDIDGNRHQFKPIKDIKEIYEELDKRQLGGFGGVAEYGITVRWDKNFLKIIRLLLERREQFRMFGGFRLGSALDCFDALKEYDFDHVALCLGAGWVKIPEIKNNLAKGVRMASDFLMALQLTGAERPELPSNLQLRLPALVVGSGLTAMDTACEALAYYPKQVENFANHYQILCNKLGKTEVEKDWGKEDKLIAKEFLEHHKLIVEAKRDDPKASITKLLQKLGGVKIIYRKKLQDSPSYRLNHEEVEKAFAEGIEFIENTTPIEVIEDEFGHIKSLKVEIAHPLRKSFELPAKALILAAGTTPNKAPFYEDKLKFELDGGTFQIIDLLGKKLPAINLPKADGIGFICAKNDQGKAVSFFGDLHPSFNGSVVKAMASAKKGYPIINQALGSLDKTGQLMENFNLPKEPTPLYSNFLKKINQDFTVKVKEVNVLSNYFTELVVYAPLLSKKTKLGHIFRLHNYCSLAKNVILSKAKDIKMHNEIFLQEKLKSQRDSSFSSSQDDNLLFAMEGVAVTTYKINPEKGTITVMLVNDGGSSSMVKNLKPDEPIIFMGPTGNPSPIFKEKTVVLIAGGRGIFPLAGLAAEYKKCNCRVILFCGFHKKEDVVKKEELDNSCDELILDFSGDVVQAVVNYFKNSKEKIDAILTMGNDEMMHKVAKIYHQDLKENLSDSSVGITSLNSPMQCMLKGVCAQCLQKKTDKNGQTRYFYACLSQDQKMLEIDFDFLKKRCSQNSLPEKLTNSWLSLN
jgi:NADPH-dependent glutamate synthase beta subunit-like oxidoreductase/NAD(P)H-flavin reductase